MPEISLIVPVYNSEKYLTRCIESVIGQTLSDWELILVTDGCTDGSNEICDKFAQTDGRIRVIHKDHGGVSKARNEGIRSATGKYIFFMDSDDYIMPNYFADLMDKPGDLVCQPYEVVDDNDNVINREHMAPELIENSTDALRRILVDGIIGGSCLKRFRADIIKNNNIFFPEDLDFGEDTCFSLQYAKFCREICVDDTANYKYVKHNNRDSLSSGVSYDRILMLKKSNQVMSGIVYPDDSREERKLFLDLFEDTCQKRVSQCVYGARSGFTEGWKALKIFSEDPDFMEVLARGSKLLLPDRVKNAVLSRDRKKMLYEHIRRYVALRYYRFESRKSLSKKVNQSHS